MKNKSLILFMTVFSHIFQHFDIERDSAYCENPEI